MEERSLVRAAAPFPPPSHYRYLPGATALDIRDERSRVFLGYPMQHGHPRWMLSRFRERMPGFPDLARFSAATNS